jgi:DNA-binding transcriptional ArsR family regulator
MPGDADVAAVAALIGEPARAAVLEALADGRALAASTLASEANVAPSTLSVHLARLVDGGLIRVEPSGRHRYFRLAGPEVADAVEALARLAPAKPIRSLRQQNHSAALRQGRSCYDHLAGRLGVALTDALVRERVVRVVPADGAARDPVLGTGRANRFELTAAGRERLERLGVVLERPGGRPLVRHCVDWSEQRPHVAGVVGAALLELVIARRWAVRGERRVVRVTEAGRVALVDQFGVDAAALA